MSDPATGTQYCIVCTNAIEGQTFWQRAGHGDRQGPYCKGCSDYDHFTETDKAVCRDQAGRDAQEWRERLGLSEVEAENHRLKVDFARQEAKGYALEAANASLNRKLLETDALWQEALAELETLRSALQTTVVTLAEAENARLQSELSRLTGPREPSLPVPDMVWPEWLEWQADLMEAWKPGPDPIGPLHGAGMATAYTGLAKHYRSEAVRIRKRRASREPSPAPNQEKS